MARGGAQGIDSGPLSGAVVAIGNFDGVHRGHRAVIGAALTRARELGRKAAALTFTPHPRRFLRPQDTLFELSDERNKLRLLAATGLDGAVVMRFDAALAATSAEDFVVTILAGALGIGGAAIGFDFHFGKNRMGSPSFLTEQGARLGVCRRCCSAAGRRGATGIIRRGACGTCGRQGRRGDGVAGRAMVCFGRGHPWRQAGARVWFSDGQSEAKPVLRSQAWHLRCARSVAGKRHDGVASFGRRPMFDDGAPLLEVSLFDFDSDLYGQAVDVAFIGWIRHEQKFESVEALQHHMKSDAAQARDVLNRAGSAFPLLGDI